jgi:hypothetical protein
MRDSFEDKIQAKLETASAMPDDGLWNRVAADLDALEYTSAIHQQLDSIDDMPGDRVWLNIAQALHPQKTPSRRPALYRAVAAAVFCIFCIGIGYQVSKTQDTEDYMASQSIPQLQSPAAADALPELALPLAIEQSSIAAGAPNAMNTKSWDTTVSPKVFNTQFALDEVITLPLPDSVLPTPIQSLPFSYSNPSEDVIEVLVADVLKPVQKSDRPGLESAVNFVLGKVLGAKRAHLQMEAQVKGQKKAWKVQFDSKLFSVSGAVPYGRLPVVENVEP